MRVAVLEAIGAPLRVEDRPELVPRAGEVVVDVVAAPVLSHAGEVFSGAREYAIFPPLVPGTGGVGQVRAVGRDATRLRAGDWVFCDATVRSRDDAVAPDVMLQRWNAYGDGAERLQAYFHDGTWAEQVLVPIESAVKLGEITEGEAARWCALTTLLVPFGGVLAGGLQAGQTLLVSGATGHFGSAGVAVALAMGAAQVIAPGREAGTLARLAERFGPRVSTVQLAGEEHEDRERMREAATGQPTPVEVSKRFSDALFGGERAGPSCVAQRVCARVGHGWSLRLALALRRAASSITSMSRDAGSSALSASSASSPSRTPRGAKQG
jgi:alcohol dehydrogenase